MRILARNIVIVSFLAYVSIMTQVEYDQICVEVSEIEMLLMGRVGKFTEQRRKLLEIRLREILSKIDCYLELRLASLN